MFRNLWQHAVLHNEDGGDGTGGSGDSGGASGAGGTATKVPPAPDRSPATGGDDLGFPANTPVKEMTEAQQAAYWKHHARKWENRATGREDYDDVKAELDRLKRERMSDQDKAVEDAKRTAREEALREFGPKAVETMLTGILTARGIKDDEVKAQLEFVNLSKFLTPKGEVDTEKVNNYVQGVAPGRSSQQWPDMGGGRRGDPGNRKAGGSVQAGRDAFDQRHKKQSNN